MRAETLYKGMSGSDTKEAESSRFVCTSGSVHMLRGEYHFLMNDDDLC